MICFVRIVVGDLSCAGFEYKAIVNAQSVEEAKKFAEEDLRDKLGDLGGEYRAVHGVEMNLEKETVLMGKIVA